MKYRSYTYHSALVPAVALGGGEPSARPAPSLCWCLCESRHSHDLNVRVGFEIFRSLNHSVGKAFLPFP